MSFKSPGTPQVRADITCHLGPNPVARLVFVDDDINLPANFATFITGSLTRPNIHFRLSQFADVVIELEPFPDAEFEFGERVVGGAD